MSKKAVSLFLVFVLSMTMLAACGGSTTGQTTGGNEAASTTETPAAQETPAPAPADSGLPHLKVMLMPQGDMNQDTVDKVTAKLNEYVEPILGMSVEFVWSGGAWAFDKEAQEVQLGNSDVDIMPAHSWSNPTYLVGAQTGQWVRLDDPDNNLLEKFGKDIYGKSSPAIVQAATVPGVDGNGIYGVLIEKDSVSLLGFLVNQTILDKYELSVEDFPVEDLAAWEPALKKIKDGEGDNFYPLNVEAEVMDRIINHKIYVGDTVGPLGLAFDNANPAATKIEHINRYNNDEYKAFVKTMNKFFKAGFIDPAEGQADTAPTATVKYRETGEYALSTFAYAPGAENTEAARTGQDIRWLPGWSAPIGTTDSYMGAGLAVYAGSKNKEKAVEFLNLLASDQVVGNLLAEGFEGESYEAAENGTIKRINDRAGWNIWRYGVVGDTSAATPLWDVDPTGNEWKNFKSFNDDSAIMECLGFLFDRTPVEMEYSNSSAVITKWSIPLGSGASDPKNLDTFLKELEDAGAQKVVDEANRQYEEWIASK